MSAMECNFTFDGKHCLRDFDCFYIYKGRPISGDSNFRTFEISGADGDLIYGDERTHETITHKGTLYLMHTPPTDAAAMRIYRQISAWLKAGRRRLIWDYEPEKFLLAEAAAGMDYTESNWPDGGMEISLRCQPLAYDLREAIAGGVIEDTAAHDYTLPLYTGEPAPVCCDITNTGTAAITGAVLTAGARQVIFSGMALAAGQTLQISMETPVGASIGADSALPKATRFDYLTANGPETVTVTLNFGSGTKQATVKAHARGRWV